METADTIVTVMALLWVAMIIAGAVACAVLGLRGDIGDDN